ncbi:hypothetical protein BU26DRAFT_232550 [Trematosphaeria pertusa]|uniref:RNase MRP protein 1 RNA binding domain-containing protein n=1 Tax=Trematosphaeria pertusa TaxID=390896 RepID=A0A6A6IV42_9PLEO|nr:uncharacterized protein BU26DRAFT_232550 [Trematosphaeria pertusa]KAF2253967.1 hypothetical protein BU26DRAFT_232550 [Trematosphaeria pertusa]
MATISAEALLAASAKDKQDLKDIQELLDRLFTRNRNQHRRNHWFKSLHQFRKQLGLLVQEMSSTKKVSAAAIMEARLKYWDEKCIHQWYLHFTQLVAVGPFAVLGLVLMACTARVCRITGITALYEEIASEDMKGVLSAVDDGHVADEFGGLLDEEEVWDLGEVIVREE